ncbi:MAG: CheR family methyltransferase, partial [Pyrinomonadaceae bacterium]
SEKGIEKARPGLYSKDIAEDVSPERLRRFFTEADGGYRVSKPIRDMVVFARQNVIADPPFSRLDLISCRNLLIYLEPVLQKQVLPTLHYALKPEGILWLGSSETVGSSSDLFAPEDKKHKFYSKKPATARPRLRPARGDAARQSAVSGRQMNGVSEQPRGEQDAQKEADRILLARYSPAGVLVNAEMEILQFRGSTGAYLEPPSGKATLNLLKMAREGLMLPLRVAIQKAKKDDKTIRKEGARVNYDGEFRQVNLEVIPIKGLAAHERSYLVLFEPVAPTAAPEADETAGSRQKAEGGRSSGGAHAGRAVRHTRIHAIARRAAGSRQRRTPIRQRGDSIVQRRVAEHQ